MGVRELAGKWTPMGKAHGLWRRRLKNPLNKPRERDPLSIRMNSQRVCLWIDSSESRGFSYPSDSKNEGRCSHRYPL